MNKNKIVLLAMITAMTVMAAKASGSLNPLEEAKAGIAEDVRYTAETVMAAKASEAVHPIDAQQAACMESNTTMNGMIVCSQDALAKWEAEMNQNYNRLMVYLSPAQQSALKKAQAQWLNYRDSDVQLSIAINSEAGSIGKLEIVGIELELTKQRAIILDQYYQDVSEQ